MKALKLKFLSIAGVLFLTACASQPPDNSNRIKVSDRFKGSLPCHDCSAINTDLILNRNAVTGAPAGFYLHEERVDAPGGDRVNSSWGRWLGMNSDGKTEQKIYILWPESGPQRAYQLSASGKKLQPIDNKGELLSDAKGSPVYLKETEVKFGNNQESKSNNKN